MRETLVRDQAVTRSGQALPRIEKNQAVSFLADFAAVRHLFVGYRPPARPNRNRPMPVVDPQLRDELDAWDAASDEALERLESDLPE